MCVCVCVCILPTYSMYLCGVSMAVGTGGGGRGGQLPPQYFANPKKFKSLKIMTYKSVYSNKDKIGF